MANEQKALGSNGADQRTIDQLGTGLRDEGAPPVAEFTLARLGEFFVQHGREQQQWTREFAEHLLETERRKMAYLEAIVGKLK